MRVDYICETCGNMGFRYYAKGKLPGHFFCSYACQNIWQKTRQDIVAKNKDPEFREKVSRALKRRKEVLGEHYHSKEAKAKIGMATKERWEQHKEVITKVLSENAINLRTREDYPYNSGWKKIRKRILDKVPFCCLCGERNDLHVHHIIPYDISGDNREENLVALCVKHHRAVEHWSWKIFEAVSDWEITRDILRQKFNSYLAVVAWKLKQLKSAS